jgi:hypothetical protein
MFAKAYRATRSFAISVICENAVAIWLGCVSMKKLLALLAQPAAADCRRRRYRSVPCSLHRRSTFRH